MQDVVIVTGGSRGIGAQTCKLLAKQGYAVVINYLNNQVRAEAVAEQVEANGGNAVTIQADVSVESDVKRLFAEATQRLGQVTHLVNNAGQLFSQSEMKDISAVRLIKTFEVNVLSCFLCCREFVNTCPEGKSIVNLSSGAAKTGSPFEYVDYAASKGAVDSLTIGLAKELAAKGVRVNGVRPGLIETEIHADGGEPDRVARLASKIPLQRGGQPMEVAEAISWLLSDKSSFVTGTFIDTTGGL